ncbi:hypothetical protein IF188_19800 [Microbacterium sp. NEAU-LLC]|uniref:Uncharacterized protein n=1 Tax=Microbacterium helvum TaxID=2773713 RepID=A0ABR8NWH9_9MICO|nr:hypothetical protein [Microbacterium helvum]MBD3943941.1 hypothetical protein [Microbacterium helvum]
MTRRAALRLTLPGEWQSFTLSPDDEAIAGEVAAFVRERLGRRDDQATLRAQQRAGLGEAVRRARDAGATQFHFSLKAPGGLAFASTVAEYCPHLPLGESTDAVALADALVGVLAAEVDGAEPDQRWEAFELAGGVVFEREGGLVLRRDRRLAASDPEHDAPTTVVDYWLTEPGRNRVVLLSFTTALAELAPLMIELFDAVVGDAKWIEQDDVAALRAELRG